MLLQEPANSFWVDYLSLLLLQLKMKKKIEKYKKEKEKKLKEDEEHFDDIDGSLPMPRE